jgi:hypothetical protein
MAQETLTSMSRSYDVIISSASFLATPFSSDIKDELEQQGSLLKCLYLRSQAVEARLKNEINLVRYSIPLVPHSLGHLKPKVV